MSKPINPLAIGGFTVGALALLVVGLLVFGGQQWLRTDRVRYVIYFDSSLNGLDVGAPVKMQGVKIGQVTEISIQLDPKSAKIYKPVVIEIDRTLLTGPDGQPFPKADTKEHLLRNRDKMVAAGFRARLEMQSLLTGLLYVDLDVHQDNEPVFIDLKYKGMLEVPSVPTTADVIRTTAEEVLAKLRNLPLEQIVQDFADSMNEIKDLLASDEVKQSRVALAKTLEGMDKTVATLNRNLEPMLKDTTLLVRDTRTMVKDIRRDIGPVMASADKTLSAATAALEKTQESMADVGDAFGPESAFNETLESLRDASRSIRNLTDYLERHPESLISGKAN